jgi:dipeptidyl aminopeptidase/acylaminoacyl peptidase
VLDIATEATRVLVDTWGGVFAAAWCDGGRRLAFIGSPEHGIIFRHHEGNVWTIDAAEGGEPECRTASVAPGVGLPALVNDLPTARMLYTPRLFVDGNDAYVTGPVGGQAIAYRVALTGPESVERVVESEGSSYVADFHPRHGVLHYATSFVDPPDLVLGARRLTALNDELLETIARPEVRHLEVTAPDGLRTDAWAFTPPGEGPWPTVLYVHGGPWCTFGSVYTIDIELLVAAGIAVVANNFRGSGGYSSEFSQKIIGDWGGFASLDHHATVDEAIRLGIADPARVGVCGLSHGGFATTWLAATSDRFKAAVAENPITDFTTFFDITDSEWWMRGEFGGTPREVPEIYRATSPLTYAPDCKTPMLLIVGEQDLCCNPLQAEQYYRVLRSNGVPTKMLRLPNSFHGGTHDGPVPDRVAQNRAQVDWFRQYLL